MFCEKMSSTVVLLVTFSVRSVHGIGSDILTSTLHATSVTDKLLYTLGI